MKVTQLSPRDILVENGHTPWYMHLGNPPPLSRPIPRVYISAEKELRIAPSLNGKRLRVCFSNQEFWLRAMPRVSAPIFDQFVDAFAREDHIELERNIRQRRTRNRWITNIKELHKFEATLRQFSLHLMEGHPKVTKLLSLLKQSPGDVDVPVQQLLTNIQKDFSSYHLQLQNFQRGSKKICQLNRRI